MIKSSIFLSHLRASLVVLIFEQKAAPFVLVRILHFSFSSATVAYTSHTLQADGYSGSFRAMVVDCFCVNTFFINSAAKWHQTAFKTIYNKSPKTLVIRLCSLDK